ncbi:hypothetical protein V8G54_035753 [Vigna mungo]|uniref:Protein kinase domain-containing protein n=1 Tax=Vigna mungo TaxID=3915 RepID=A0AAQ3MH75_VIGMU
MSSRRQGISHNFSLGESEVACGRKLQSRVVAVSHIDQMSTKRNTWKSVILILGCYKVKCPLEESEKQVLKQGSFQRLCLSDVSISSSTQAIEDLSISFAGSKLYAFTLEELREATNSFSWSNMLGEGGFGPVYKGFVDDKLRPGLKAQTVAVKRLDLDGLQGHREWLVNSFAVVQTEYSAAMPWSTRMKIALGAAKGLVFLHESDKPVIYRDFKASNILLDSDFTAKLSDFGLAKDGPEGEDTYVTTRIMGTQGYAAPEYIMTGAMKVAMLAFKCLSPHPNARPTMSDVVKVLEPLQDFDDVFIGPFVYVAVSENGNKHKI